MEQSEKPAIFSPYLLKELYFEVLISISLIPLLMKIWRIQYKNNEQVGTPIQ